MNERQAREATLLQAFETAQPPSPNWTDEDRRWADRVALEAAGSDAGGADFVAERARHAMHRLLPRETLARHWLARRPRDGAWLLLIVAVAFGLGIAADAVGGGRRINLLAPPFWGVVLWNFGVYLALVIVPLLTALRRRPTRPGPLRRFMDALLRLGQRAPPRASGKNPSAAALGRFGSLWATRSAGLASLRAQRLLHVGAAALAVGLVAGLYVRGLVFDYRVAWESTFLRPESVHALLATVLAPAAALAGVGLPDAAGFAALQAVPGQVEQGAPAASWIHLLALTMVLFVIGPRLLLAAFAAARLRLGSARFRLPLAEPYFQRIVGLHRGSEADVAVFPYAHTPKPQAVLGLQGLVAEAFGPRATVRFAPTAAFGAEDDPVALVAAGPPPSHAVALCELGATPEAESHGRYLGRLAAELPPATVFALVVDEAAFRQRFAGMQERLGQRRKAWQSFAESLGGVPAFVDLEIPVDADAVARLHDAFGRSLRPDAANAAGGDGRAGRASPTGPTGRAGWAGRVDRVGPEGPEHPENPTRSVDPPQAR